MNQKTANYRNRGINPIRYLRQYFQRNYTARTQYIPVAHIPTIYIGDN